MTDGKTKEHTYAIETRWEGGVTTSYRAYSRTHQLHVEGKPTLNLSAEPAFRGDPTQHNPEELLLASVSGCHMLWYLHLCSAAGVHVVRYVDTASSVMTVDLATGGGRVTKAILRPTVTLAAGSDVDKAKQLHGPASDKCFIANSVNFPIAHEATIVVAQ